MAVIKLQSKDKEVFEVSEKVARMSLAINTMLDDLGVSEADSEPVPVLEVDGKTLKLVIQWAEHHQNDPAPCTDEDEEEQRLRSIPEWDKQFLAVDNTTLFELLTAANFLDMKGLFKMSARAAADILATKTPEQIREEFGIVNDLDPEREAQIRKENEYFEQK